MKNSWPSRLFIFIGIFLWIPIILGFLAMLLSTHPLAVYALSAIALTIASLIISKIVRLLI